MQLVLSKKDNQRGSCLDSPGSVTSLTISAFGGDNSKLEDILNEHMARLASELQQTLQHVTEELATEVNREQQHLMHMQDQVQETVCDVITFI